MIRVLPCKFCGMALEQNGQPMWLTSFPPTAFGDYYYCCRSRSCNPSASKTGFLQSISHAEFMYLPFLGAAELIALGMGHLFKDLIGLGVKLEQAMQLYDHGWKAAELLTVSR